MVEDSGINYDYVPNLQNTTNKAGKELFENDYLFDLAIPEVFGISYIIVTAKNAMYLYQGKTDLKKSSISMVLSDVKHLLWKQSTQQL